MACERVVVGVSDETHTYGKCDIMYEASPHGNQNLALMSIYSLSRYVDTTVIGNYIVSTLYGKWTNIDSPSLTI